MQPAPVAAAAPTADIQNATADAALLKAVARVRRISVDRQQQRRSGVGAIISAEPKRRVSRRGSEARKVSIAPDIGEAGNRLRRVGAGDARGVARGRKLRPSGTQSGE